MIFDNFAAFVQQLFTDLVNIFDTMGLVFAFIVLILAMIIQAIISPIASEMILAASGAIFYEAFGFTGLWMAIVGGIIGSMFGALIAYQIALYLRVRFTIRYLEYQQTHEKKAEESNFISDQTYMTRFIAFIRRIVINETEYLASMLRDQGYAFIFLCRAIPVVPFDTISYASGFVKVPKLRYLISTFLGTIPRVVFFVLIGIEFIDVFYKQFQLFLLYFTIFTIFIYAGSLIFRLLIQKMAPDSKFTFRNKANRKEKNNET